MRKILMTGLFLLITNLVKGLNPNSKSPMYLTKLKMAMCYLSGIKIARLLLMSFLGAGLCLTFLISALILFHWSIISYAPWTAESRLNFSLTCTVVYIVASIITFRYFFDEEKWLKIFNADKVIKELSEASDEQGEEEDSSI